MISIQPIIITIECNVTLHTINWAWWYTIQYNQTIIFTQPNSGENKDQIPLYKYKRYKIIIIYKVKTKSNKYNMNKNNHAIVSNVINIK